MPLRESATKGSHLEYSTSNRAMQRLAVLVATGAAALLFVACAKAPAPPAPPAVSPELVAQQDRAAIENLLADYYGGFGAGGEHDFSAYFTPDGVLDVNGLVATGADQIRAMYKQTAGAPPPARPANAPPPGRNTMVLSNLSIHVEGDRATSSSLFTALHTNSLTGKPWVNEYGREHDEFVKRDGRWLISKRTVTTDAGMPASLLKGYIPR